MFRFLHALFTSLLAVKYSALVSLVSFSCLALYAHRSHAMVCLTSLLIHDELLIVMCFLGSDQFHEYKRVRPIMAMAHPPVSWIQRVRHIMALVHPSVSWIQRVRPFTARVQPSVSLIWTSSIHHGYGPAISFIYMKELDPSRLLFIAAISFINMNELDPSRLGSSHQFH